jgi:hypothetical protein
VDWNEDGLKDLLVGQFNGRISLYLNIGVPGVPLLTYSGYVLCGGDPILVDYDSVPFAVEWDNDGRKDLLVGDMNGDVWLYLNQGTNAAPLFTQSQFVTLASGQPLHVYSRAAPCVVDLDGDGLKDLVLGQMNGQASFFRSLGENPSPLLAEAVPLLIGGDTPIFTGPFSRFAALDWDQDGRMDLVGGGQDARLKLFRQIPPGPVAPAPILEVNFQGPATVPSTGEMLNFTCSVGNPSGQPLRLDVWADLFCPENRTLTCHTDFAAGGLVRARISMVCAAFGAHRILPVLDFCRE